MFDMRRWMQIMVSLGATIFLLLGNIGCDAPAEEEALEEEIAEEEEETITADEMGLLYTDDRWDEISNLALSPDGDTVVVESELYSLEEREVFVSQTGEDAIEVGSLDFSPDGSILASAWWGVNLYDAEDLTHIKDIRGGHELRVRFSPEGEMLGISRHGTAWLWKRTNEVEFEEVAEIDPDVDTGVISEIEFSPDGKYLVAGYEDGKIRFWDTESCELAETIDLDSGGWNHNLAFSPDGKTLAATEPDLSGEFYLFDMEDFTQKDMMEPEGRISRMQFSPDGSKLAYGLHGGGVEILCTEEWSQIYSFEQEDTVRGLSFTPDSRTMVVACGSGTLYVYGSI